MRRTLSQPALIVGSKSIQYGLVFFSFIIVARQLGPYDFGLFIAGQGLANLAAPFVESGGYSLVTRDMVAGITAKGAMGPAISTIVWLTPAALVMGWLFALFFTPSYAVIPFCLLFLSETCLARLLDLIYARNFALGRAGANALIDISSGGTRLIMAGLTFLISGTLMTWTIIYCSGTLVLLLVVWSLFIPRIRPVRLGWTELWSRMRRGINFALITSARSGHAEADRVLLAGLADPIAAGLYGAAGRIVLVLTVPFHTLQMAAYPRYFGGSHAAVRHEAARHAVLTAPAALMLATGLWFGADALPFLLGTAYFEAPMLVRALAPIIVLHAIYEPFGNALSGSHSDAIRRRYQIIVLGANVVANLLLIPAFGVWGSIAASLMSHSLLLVLFVIVAGKQDGHH